MDVLKPLKEKLKCYNVSLTSERARQPKTLKQMRGFIPTKSLISLHALACGFKRRCERERPHARVWRAD